MNFLLLLDYDGTLVPIKKHPKLAILSPNRRSLLRKLAQHPGIKLAVISGRRLSVVKKLVGIRNIVYVGNHGFEIEAGGRYWIQPAAKRTVPLLKEIKKTLNGELRYTGTFVEDKGLTLSIHFRRLANKSIAKFSKDLIRVLKPWKKKVRITHGKKVFEIRPPVNWNKGKAVKWLIKKLKLDSYFPIYIGDDQTDEDAFRALKKSGLTFLVGKKKKTAAQRTLRSVNEVYRTIGWLTKMVNPSKVRILPTRARW